MRFVHLHQRLNSKTLAPVNFGDKGKNLLVEKLDLAPSNSNA
jgi:hypothetical protein